MTSTVGQLAFAAVGPRHVCRCGATAVEHVGFHGACDHCGCERYEEAER